MKKLLLATILLVLTTAILLTGCSGQKEIQSISLDGLKTEYEIGETPDFSGVTATITYNDGSTKQATAAELQFGTIDTSTSGKKSLTVTYEKFTETFTITVKSEAVDPSGFIVDVETPASLSSLSAKKDLFLNKEYGYVVGDDNPFFFKLKLTILDANNEIVEETNYTSFSQVYLDGTLLKGDSLATYVTIDEENNSFDFTDAAIGKTFKLTTRPLDGVEGREEDMTRSLTVTVVNGLNIYEAWELNYITNYNEFDFKGEAGIDMTQVEIVDKFLATKGATRPEKLEGIVLHNDLTIEREDLPAEYFLDSNRDGEFWDYLSLFSHDNDSESKTFGVYGNYFTIYTYKLPNVCESGTGNQGDLVSNGQLFMFTRTLPKENPETFDYSQYSFKMSNLYLKDDNPSSDNAEMAGRDMRGLIAMKLLHQVCDIENIRVEAFYISFFVNGDFTVANVNESKFYNSWQNHIYLWCDNRLQSANDEPLENYVPATLNITNSEVTKSGGPIIIAQSPNLDKPKQAKSGPRVSIDENTEIWTYVTGEEAWFKGMYATQIAQEIKALGYLFQRDFGSTYITQIGENGESSGGAVFMNILMVNLMSGTDVAEVLAGTHDVDGTLDIAGTRYLDMDDSFTATNIGTGLQVGYGNPYVANLIGNYAGQAPVFATATGGTAIYDGTNLTPVNPEGITVGDYLAMFRNNMGIVLGYYHPEN